MQTKRKSASELARHGKRGDNASLPPKLFLGRTYITPGIYEYEVNAGEVLLVITNQGGAHETLSSAYFVFCVSSAFSGKIVPLLTSSLVTVTQTNGKVAIEQTHSNPAVNTVLTIIKLA